MAEGRAWGSGGSAHHDQSGPDAGPRYWDHPLKRVAPADVDLRFVDWFDFDALAFRDFKYCRVRVIASPHAEIVGRAALLECDYARFVLDEDALVTSAVAEH